MILVYCIIDLVLVCGIDQVIIFVNDMGDVYVMIINYYGEIIGWCFIIVQQDEIVEFFGCLFDCVLDFVFDYSVVIVGLELDSKRFVGLICVCILVVLGGLQGLAVGKGLVV